MSITDIESKVRELQELKRMCEELDAEIEAIEDEIKAHMNSVETDEMIAGAFNITYKEVTSIRFDSAAFRRANPDDAAKYMKTTVTRRFNVR